MWRSEAIPLCGFQESNPSCQAYLQAPSYWAISGLSTCYVCLTFLWYQYTKSRRLRSETFLVGSQLKNTWVLRIPFHSSPSPLKTHRFIALLPHDPECFLHPQGSVPPQCHFLHLGAGSTDRLAMFCPLCFCPACCLECYCQCLSLSTYVWSHNPSGDTVRAVGNWIWTIEI